MGTKILVTGAAGFIGSHVVEVLLGQGHQVIGLDNFNDYYAPQRKRANLAEVQAGLKDAAQLVFVEGDLRDADLMTGLCQEHRPEAVAHLAAMAGVRNSVANPGLYYQVNLEGTLHLLEAARAVGVGNFVFASTSSVYGNTRQIPFLETDPCDRPLAPYAASKRACEMLGYTYHHLHGLNFTALRFFTVYGPRGRPDMMPYKVLDNIFFSREVPLYNQGKMRRDWTHVRDIAQGVALAVAHPLGYEVLNLGRGQPMVVADFIAEIEKATGRKANLSSEPLPDSDVDVTFADITKARTLIGYDPQLSVAQGVADFWAWYQKHVMPRH